MVALRQSLSFRNRCGRIADRRIGLPAPQAVCRSDPHSAVAIFVQGLHRGAETTVIAVALRAVAADCTESSGRPSQCGRHPYRSIPILQERVNPAAAESRVLSQLAILPTHQSVEGADPERSVTCRQEGSNLGTGKPSQRQWHRSNSVEAIDTRLRAEPEITVGQLRDCVDRPTQESIPEGPCGMRELADIQRWIERSKSGRANQCVERSNRNQR